MRDGRMRCSMLHSILASHPAIAHRILPSRIASCHRASRIAHRILTSRIAHRVRNASWTLRMRTEDNLLRDLERFEQQTKITHERKVGIIGFSRSQVTIEHGLICSFGSNLSYCGFEMSLNVEENKPKLEINCCCPPPYTRTVIAHTHNYSVNAPNSKFPSSGPL